MEWILMLGSLVWIVGLALFAPDLLAPRCPIPLGIAGFAICGSILERRPVENKTSWNHWNLGWIRYSCHQCLYFHHRPTIYRDVKETKYEIRTVH